MNLTGNTALVTGGSRGIGASIVEALIDEGCQVIINHRRNIGKGAAQVEQLLEYAESKGVRALNILADISDRRGVERMFREIGERFDKIDHLILNAGQTPFKRFQDFNRSDWKLLLETNLVGNVGCVQACLPLMAKGGSMVFLSSTGSRTVLPNYPMGVMKSALENLVRYLDYELNPKNIRVNGVCAGLTKTDNFEQLKIAWPKLITRWLAEDRQLVLSPDEVADIVVFLCSDKSRALQGSVILADRGMTFGY